MLMYDLRNWHLAEVGIFSVSTHFNLSSLSSTLNILATVTCYFANYYARLQNNNLTWLTWGSPRSSATSRRRRRSRP